MTQQKKLFSKQDRLIIILGSIAAIGPLSIDMYLPGFSAIAKDLNTSISQVSLSLTTYFIGISLGQIAYGPLLDKYGRKRPLLIGFIIYLIAAIGCAMAPTIEVFIVLRFLLALGGCVGMVASRAIIRDRFESNEIARAFSSLILVMGVAPIIAPTLGGEIVRLLNWRYIFWFLAIYSFLLLLLVRFGLPESNAGNRNISLRPKQVWRGYLQVLKNRDFLIYGGAATLGLAGMFTYISGSPFAVMELLDFKDNQFGWLFGINASGFIAASQVNKALLKKRNSETVSFVVSIFTLGATLLLVVNAALGIIWPMLFLLSLFIFVASLGFINPNMQALALSPFKNNAGVASALIGSIRMLGGAITSALVGVFHNNTAVPMAVIMLVCATAVFLILVIKRREPLTVAIT
jgi:DHA1 family bicyclomycin/chloramphenicol resistance-like MFS transporter